MKFRVYVNNNLEGPFEVAELCELPNFSLSLSVCPDGECDWQPAASYPLITRYIDKRVVSGDYPAENAASLNLPQAPSQNWRAAVIPANIPEPRRSTPPSAPMRSNTTSGKPVGGSRGTVGAQPAGLFDRLQKMLLRERKRVLLMVLGITAVAMATPQRDNILMIYQVLSSPDQSAPPPPRNNSRSQGHTNNLWKLLKIERLAALATPVAIQRPIKPSEEVTEVGTDDLGNGMLRKTVVVTKIVDGVKISTTKSYVVSVRPAKKRKH